MPSPEVFRSASVNSSNRHNHLNYNHSTILFTGQF